MHRTYTVILASSAGSSLVVTITIIVDTSAQVIVYSAFCYTVPVHVQYALSQ